jgi:hypothetical protein
MTTRPAGTRRPLAKLRAVPDRSLWRTVRRGALWLASALMLCEWRYTPPALFSEQRSARSATATRHCRRATPCTTTKSAGAWSDSLTYLSSGADGATTLKRWPEDGLPITVWIAEAGGSNARAGIRRRIARDAFHTWMEVGVPERFVFVSDSASAMVHVLWRRQLPDRRAGQVTRQADSDGWLRSAVVELSVRNIVGQYQDTLTLRAVALHEVGHLIGLEHSPDERDIMAPWVVARQLSARDRATAKALYGVGFYEDDQ